MMPRTHNNQRRGRGGRRRGAGAPVGNVNALKSLPWVASYDLSTPAGIDSFLQLLVQMVWTGKLGSRSASSINGSLKILIEHLELSQLEKQVEELKQQAAVARKLIADKLGMDANTGTVTTSVTPARTRPRQVDAAKQDP